MRRYERSGVIVDQCEECRGIFLDRGELERLIDAETAHEPTRGEHERYEDEQDHLGDRGRGKRSSRTNFIADLFGGE